MKKLKISVLSVFLIVLSQDIYTQSYWDNIPEKVKNRNAFKRLEWLYRQPSFTNDTGLIASNDPEKPEKKINMNGIGIEDTVIPGTWIKATNPTGPVWAIVKHPVNDSIMYAGSNTTGMWKSTNRGLNWYQINNDLLNIQIQAAAISASNPNVLYCGTSSADNYGVYKTTDAGGSWIKIVTGISESTYGVQSVAVDPTNENVAYVACVPTASGVNANAGLYKTTDGGLNWFGSIAGVTQGVKNFMTVAINPLNPNSVYAGTSFLPGVLDTCYLYKSYDGGANWINLRNGLPNTNDVIRTLSISTSDTNVIIAGLFMNDTLGGAFLSNNGGYSWNRIHNEGLPNTQGTLIRSCLIKPGSVSEFYIGLDRGGNNDRGIFRSVNGGLSWSSMKDAVMDSTYPIRAIVYRTSDNTVFAGASWSNWAMGQGVFFNTLIMIGTEEPKYTGLPKTMMLFQNYPNPFNPCTSIRYSLFQRADVKLEVFNSLGQKVITLFKGAQNAGEYTLQWNGKNNMGNMVSSGVYIYRLTAGNQVISKKLIFLR